MGFDWNANVVVGYTQEVAFLNCYSRFATRCLKTANPVPSAAATKKQKVEKKRLPGAMLTKQEMKHLSEPFSETEEEVEALRLEHRVLYDEIKKLMGNSHANDIECGGLLNRFGGDADVNRAFQAAVEYLLPGQGGDFAIHMDAHGGAYGEPNDGAKRELAYLAYVPTFTTAGGGMDAGPGGVNIPWGHKRTALPTLDAETAKQVDAAFAVLVDRLGLKAEGPPGWALITTSSGG